MKIKNFSTLTSLILIILFLPIIVSAKTYHITLLTVGEVGENLIGGTADAYLEIKPGQGRIFLDSFPLTKLDTQISTRYANQIACDYLEIDCSIYDFFYTIRASSSVVGGPSASAPLTILTIGALSGIDLDNTTVMTGTINSGGSIGPVGGVKEKTIAAQKAGFQKVLIPKFTINEEELEKIDNDTLIIDNSTTWKNVTKIEDILKSQKNKSEEKISIQVVEVANLEDALLEFTDAIPLKKYPKINTPQQYKQIMNEVASGLCSKANELKINMNLTNAEINKTLEFENKSKLSASNQNYYSAASFCFNMGVMLRRIKLNQIENTSSHRLEEIRLATLNAVIESDKKLEKINITTLPNLESYIIVKERILESEKELYELKSNISPDRLAYAIERYYSAVSWSKFFEMQGKQIELDQNHLEDACNKKISEAEERINYAELYFKDFTKAASITLAEAYGNRQDKNFEMCLFKASFAKSEANLLLSSMAIETNKIEELSSEKISSAEKLISKKGHQGFFPIMGYSYYEYAKSLHENGDHISALIFSEYALELSNLEMYFPKKKKSPFTLNIQQEIWIALACTLLLGISLGSAFTTFILKREITPKPKQQLLRKKTRAKRK